jgi:hypothetical protein
VLQIDEDEANMFDRVEKSGAISESTNMLYIKIIENGSHVIKNPPFFVKKKTSNFNMFSFENQ